MSNVPSELKYAKSHERVSVDGDIATIGITDFAQSELGDVVYVDLPNVGRALNMGDTFGSVESVKTVSDVYAPISGTVTEVNPALGSQSELINSAPYEGGWMMKLQVSDASQLDELLDADGYSAIVS